MIVDTSAVVAVLSREADAEILLRTLTHAPVRRMSAASLVELNAVLAHRLPIHEQRRVERLLDVLRVETVPFDAAQAAVASRAYRDYGKGSGHPAQLNFGDCFSYALAHVLNEPLLFVGQDFIHTDLEPALQP